MNSVLVLIIIYFCLSTALALLFDRENIFLFVAGFIAVATAVAGYYYKWESTGFSLR